MLRHSIALAALSGCSLAAAQSMNNTPPRTVVPDKLASYWTMAGGTVNADVPNHGRNINDPGCATVSFVVEPTGITSNVKVERVVPDGDLGQVAASVAAGMRFNATKTNAGKERVFSWLIFPFNLPSDPEQSKAVMRQCAIENLSWQNP